MDANLQRLGPTAHWAIYSKNPGDFPDNRILSASFDAALAQSIARAGIAGQPDSAARGPDRLPWVTFVAGVVDAPTFCIMVTSESDAVDARKRGIAPSRLLVLQWDEAARYGLTFERAARMLDGLGWGTVNQGPPGADGAVRLPEPPPVDTDAVAKRIDDDLGFDWVAAVASTLLDGGQVAIAAAESFPTLEERLAILDAVCAVLPYAYRAQISAATWADHRIAHGLRLTFAARARSGQSHAELRGPAPAPSRPAAAAYQRLLHELRDKGITTERLVAHLAKQRTIESCQTAEDAFERLIDVDLPTATFEAIRAKRGSLGQVARVLAGGGWHAFDDDQRPSCIRFLADAVLAGDPSAAQAAAQLVRQHWSPEAATVLGAAAAGQLAEDLDGSLRTWAAVLEPAQAQALIVATAERVAASASQRAGQAFAGLMWHPAAGTSPLDAGVLAPFLDHPTAAVYLLMAFLDRPDDRADALASLLTRWHQLGQGRDLRWLHPFAVAVHDGLRVEAEHLDELRVIWRDGIVSAAAAATQMGRLASVPSAMWRELVNFAAWAIEHGDVPAITRLNWLLQQALAGPLNDPDGARIDLLCLAVRGEFSVARRSRYEVSDRFVAEFGEAWRNPTLDPIHHRLVAHATEGAEASFAGIRHLMRLAEVVGPELMKPAVPTVFAFMNAAPENWALDLTDAWTRLLGGLVADIRNLRGLCERGADRMEVAAAGVTAVARGADANVVAEVLSSWPGSSHFGSPGDLLLCIAHPWQPQFEAAARALHAQLLARVAHGMFGEPHVLVNEMKSQQELLGQQQKALLQAMPRDAGGGWWNPFARRA